MNPGAGGADIIVGDAGDDWIEGERGNNSLLAGETAGADTILAALRVQNEACRSYLP